MALNFGWYRKCLKNSYKMVYSKPYFVSCFGLLVAAGAAAQVPAVKHSKPVAASETQLIQSVEGAPLFQAYCASCHGTDAKGSGPMSEWLKVKTPDLTRISIRAGGTFPLARVQKIIAGDDSVKSGHGTRDMPVWGPIFSQVSGDRDWGQMRVYNLSEFIQTLQQKQ